MNAPELRTYRYRFFSNIAKGTATTPTDDIKQLGDGPWKLITEYHANIIDIVLQMRKNLTNPYEAISKFTLLYKAY